MLGSSANQFEFEWEARGSNITRHLYQEYIKGYYRLVMGVDDHITRVLDYLEQSGLAPDTLVIYTSDQGFSLREHASTSKQWMYRTGAAPTFDCALS